VAAALLAFGLLFFAKPTFHVSLSSMNTVSAATIKADALFTKVWGNLGKRIFLMSSADSIAAIQHHDDLTLAKIDQDIRKNILVAAFVPSMIFPGRERGEQNLAAWHQFWNSRRVEEVKKALLTAGTKLGFALMPLRIFSLCSTLHLRQNNLYSSQVLLLVRHCKKYKIIRPGPIHHPPAGEKL